MNQRLLILLAAFLIFIQIGVLSPGRVYQDVGEEKEIALEEFIEDQKAALSFKAPGIPSDDVPEYSIDGNRRRNGKLRPPRPMSFGIRKLSTRKKSTPKFSTTMAA
jgi:hypothetical protein